MAEGPRQVAVTGMGIVSPLGHNLEDFFGNLMSGKSAARRISPEYSEPLSGKLAATADYDPLDHFTKKEAGALDRVSQMALTAAASAMTDAGLSPEEGDKIRAGVCIGTGMGGSRTIDDVCFSLYSKGVSRVSPLSIVRVMANAPASHISIRYGFCGPCLTYSTACSSSAVAIGEAFRHIKAGLADVMIAGGTESLITYASYKSWESLGVLAVEDTADPASSCRPFSKDRTGFVLGEGAAVVVIEELGRARARGARIYGELAGYGSTADGHHITGPTVDGQARAMELALREAGMAPGDIGYINAHGTATTANDLVETQAIKKVFGDAALSVPVSSTKSMHGHLMGAAGAAELIVSLLAMQKGEAPPTMHLRVPDPECDLDYVANKGRTGLHIKAVMSNSFAFGGTNAVLVARSL